MRLFFALLCAPLLLCAQIEFGPIRLDNGRDSLYYCAEIERSPLTGNYLCTWSSINGDTDRAYGQWVTPAGDLVGANILYFQSPPDSGTCLPEMTVKIADDGSEARCADFT